MLNYKEQEQYNKTSQQKWKSPNMLYSSPAPRCFIAQSARILL